MNLSSTKKAEWIVFSAAVAAVVASALVAATGEGRDHSADRVVRLSEQEGASDQASPDGVDAASVGPVAVTGYRRGDAVDPARPKDWIEYIEAVDPGSEPPLWVAVVRDDVVIGYVYNTPNAGPIGATEPQTEDQGDVWILDEAGHRIGSFVLGVPVLDTDE